MKILNFIIDKTLTLFAYLLILLCFYILLYTDLSGTICTEGFVLAMLSLLTRDFHTFYTNRKRLKRYGFEVTQK